MSKERKQSTDAAARAIRRPTRRNFSPEEKVRILLEGLRGEQRGGHGRHAVDGLPWAHTVFGNLKTWLRGAYHGVSPKHLQRYLNEFQFRFNKRWHEADLFSPVLQAAIDADPFPYRHLTAEPTGYAEDIQAGS